MSQRFNFEEIKKFTGDDQDALKQMLEIFLKTVPETLKQVNDNFQSRNHKQFSYFSHKLKSSIDLLSIKELKILIREMETCDKEDFQSERISSALQKVNASINELLPEIKKQG
jgi:HPt (histidine-containing phosphotransfer) domain-containing protein